MTSDEPHRPATARRVREWKLWHLPTAAWIYVLAVDLIAGAVALAAILGTPVPADRWTVAAVLAVSALAHLHLSHAIERIRRDRSHTPHVDLCSLWTFAGALLLPPPPAIALVVAIYTHRWWLVGRRDPSRPPHRGVFTIAMMTLTTLAVTTLSHATGLADQLHNHTISWAGLVVLLLALATQWATNTLLVGAVITLAIRPHRRRDALGSAADNLLELAQLALGAFLAVAAAHAPALAVLMVIPAVTLHRVVLLHQFEIAARTDLKTGLLNAVTWQHQADIALMRTRMQPGGRLALFMIDIDHFSDINNHHGHQTGDAILTRVTRLLARSVRRTDTIGRFGGDEFTVLLPDTDQAEALAIAERIHHHIRGITLDDGTTITLSLGIALYPDTNAHDIDTLLANADTALYAAKHAGRNRTHLATSEPTQPTSPTHTE
ncbi:GGDEF domain-containing protein [Amycolatopsis aidingensis]|uniref:GGDEF domain-containing protein n=1 Tax=Amycolatopsis aidingensis TaxID=2842453 RepID=UPI001C0B77F6|nr:GGDEF domain-containing protein [Amycolatopsis aidingensis]